jgi:CubicO group peptidase (beta-lactamase class C family)
MIMRMKSLLTCLASMSLAIPLAGFCQQVVYPAKGQAPEQQKSDEAECHTWAIQQSNYDPANPPQAATAQQAPVTGSGAAAGAAVGAIGGNEVGNAAAKGAVVGGVAQRNRNRGAADQANANASQQQQAGLDAYQKARAACLEGRGYTVK